MYNASVILQRACPSATKSLLGSLIPLPPFGSVRDAIQSASRGILVVQCWPNYKVANRLVWLDIVLPSEFLQRHAHLPSNKREKKKNGNRYLSRATYSNSLFRDIFHWKEVNENAPLDTLICEENQRRVNVNSNKQFDLSQLPGFDVSRAYDWVGGTVDGTILTFNGEYSVGPRSPAAKYSYQTGLPGYDVVLTLFYNSGDLK